MNALVLCLAGVARAATFPDAQLLRDEGWSVTLVVSTLGRDVHVPDGVRLIELSDTEAVTALSRLERLVVWRLPRLSVRVLRRLVMLAEQNERLTAVGGRAAEKLPGLLVAQPHYSRLAHRRWQIGPYRALRAFILWRLIRRCALPELLTAGRDLVVVGDQDSVTIGWHLARELPHTPVTVGLNLERLAQSQPKRVVSV